MATFSDAEAANSPDFELADAPHTPLTEVASSVESQDVMELLPEESTGECCKCCEDCCCERCGCKACCGRCRMRCLFSCCRRCCAHRCQGNPRDAPKPVDVTWDYALRQVADDNIVLGCIFQFRPWPLCLERWLLLLLFLTTAVFVQYAEEAMGPICVREYLAQCPVFTTPKTLLPMTYVRLGPPDVEVPEGARINGRRLASHAASDLREQPSAAGRILGNIDENVGGVVSSTDKSSAEQIRESLLTRLSMVFGSAQFNCDKPMCDIYYPKMIDWFSLWHLTNKIWGTSDSHSIPFTSEAVIVGYCKCEGPIYDGITSAKVGGEARSFIITLILQTLLPKVFRAAFSCTSGAIGSSASSSCCFSDRRAARCRYIVMASLLTTVATMCAGIYLLKFDPQGWRNALAISALSAAVLDPLVSLLQLLLCVRSGWPLRRCGCGAPTEELQEMPWLYRGFVKWFQGDAWPVRGSQPSPARMGKGTEI